MCALIDHCVIKVVGPSLGEQLDALFGKGGFQELASSMLMTRLMFHGTLTRQQCSSLAMIVNHHQQ